MCSKTIAQNLVTTPSEILTLLAPAVVLTVEFKFNGTLTVWHSTLQGGVYVAARKWELLTIPGVLDFEFGINDADGKHCALLVERDGGWDMNWDDKECAIVLGGPSFPFGKQPWPSGGVSKIRQSGKQEGDFSLVGKEWTITTKSKNRTIISKLSSPELETKALTLWLPEKTEGYVYFKGEKICLDSNGDLGAEPPKYRPIK